MKKKERNLTWAVHQQFGPLPFIALGPERHFTTRAALILLVTDRWTESSRASLFLWCAGPTGQHLLPF